MDIEKIEPTVHSKLEHLSKEQRNDLYGRFYSEKNSVLISEFEIKENANLHRLFEPKIIEEVCEFCSVFMWEYYPSKSEHRYGGKKVCPKCEHTIYPDNRYSLSNQRCTCENCEHIRLEKLRQEQEEIERKKLEKREKIISILTEQQHAAPIMIDSLQYYDKICFLTYLKGIEELSSESSRFYFFRPFSNLAPTDSLKTDIIKLLLDKKTLRIKMDVDIEIYNDFIDNDNFDALIESNSLELNVDSNSDLYQDCIVSLEQELIQDPNKGFIVWRRVALHECVEYLNLELESIGLPTREGDTTIELFKELLKKYSVSQINKITQRVIEKAAKDKLSNVSYDKRIANNVIAGIRGYGNKGIDEGWYTTFYGIPEQYRKPQTLLSKVLFNDVLKIENLGYTKVPNLEDLRYDKPIDEPNASV